MNGNKGTIEEESINASLISEKGYSEANMFHFIFMVNDEVMLLCGLLIASLYLYIYIGEKFCKHFMTGNKVL